MASFPFNGTRVGEVFASLEARDPTPDSPDYSEDILQAQRLVAGAFFVETSLPVIRANPREKVSDALSDHLGRYLDFLALVSPQMFATPEASRKTRAAIRMVLLDIRDMATTRKD